MVITASQNLLMLHMGKWIWVISKYSICPIFKQTIRESQMLRIDMDLSNQTSYTVKVLHFSAVIFVERLLCVRHCPRHELDSGEQNRYRNLCSWSLQSREGTGFQ